ncbi:GatB/YqeY domain-containing protein [Pedobacter flavus]|uniref:GatB/YqeY domain-containing protein n=1 Tax=Pedobacter flavus TaxID=3113906 RepID=A0ABU7H1H5_9SPHI|nr:GatB/YqeY domain-containing protein [Pedobacter sp. VNH31]MEE1885185.1 GatB/YqeY domain-containing protein [Pedobacter sp. VNH31]
MLSNSIDQEIKSAMLAKDQAKLRGLRAIKAAFLLAKTEKGASTDIDEETEIKLLQKLVKQRKESADIYKSQGREDLFNIEQEEISVIEQYLPAQLSRDEIKVIIENIIQEMGGATQKEMGKVMGAANKALAGKADGKLIAEIVKSLLS